MERLENTHAKVFGAEWVTHEVQVTGLVNRSLRLTASELRAMEQTEIHNVGIICGSGRRDGVVERYRGVRLTAVLERAGVIVRRHGAANAIFVTLATSDGRLALFSYQELFNSAVGEQAIVIIERDGQPLDENEGEIAFISAHDLRTGPRRLRYLQRIEVHEYPSGESSE